jgi:ABC-2 type transport system ATP-binding protein
VEIRELLHALVHQRGVTVFMSSHILAEVDRVATRIGIIHHGRMLEELDSHMLERMRQRYVVVCARDLQAAHAALASAGYRVESSDHSAALRLDDPRAVDAPEAVAVTMVSAGVPPTRLAVEQEDLEDYFLRLTAGRP